MEKEYVICEECGKQFSRITNTHLLSHGMTVAASGMDKGISHILVWLKKFNIYLEYDDINNAINNLIKDKYGIDFIRSEQTSNSGGEEQVN